MDSEERKELMERWKRSDELAAEMINKLNAELDCAAIEIASLNDQIVRLQIEEYNIDGIGDWTGTHYPNIPTITYYGKNHVSTDGRGE